MGTLLLRSASAATPAIPIVALDEAPLGGLAHGVAHQPSEPSGLPSVAASREAAWGESPLGADALTEVLPIVGAQVLPAFSAPSAPETALSPTDVPPTSIPALTSPPVPPPAPLKPNLPMPPDPPAPLAPPAPVPPKLPSLPDPPDPSSPHPGSSSRDGKEHGLKAQKSLWGWSGVRGAMMRESMRERVLGRGGFARFGHH